MYADLALSASVPEDLQVRLSDTAPGASETVTEWICLWIFVTHILPVASSLFDLCLTSQTRGLVVIWSVVAAK